MTALVLASILFATTPSVPEATVGKPLAGVTVKVARYSGAQFAASGGVSAFRQGDGKINSADPVWSKKTDADGKFDFGVLPKGQYTIVLELPAGAPPLALVTVKQGTAEPVKDVWDVAKNRPHRVAGDAGARETVPAIVIESNGVDPVKGTCNTTVVRSQSNVRNN